MLSAIFIAGTCAYFLHAASTACCTALNRVLPNKAQSINSFYNKHANKLSATLAGVILVAKENFDAQQYGNWDVKDLVANGVGLLLFLGSEKALRSYSDVDLLKLPSHVKQKIARDFKEAVREARILLDRHPEVWDEIRREFEEQGMVLPAQSLEDKAAAYKMLKEAPIWTRCAAQTDRSWQELEEIRQNANDKARGIFV